MSGPRQVTVPDDRSSAETDDVDRAPDIVSGILLHLAREGVVTNHDDTVGNRAHLRFVQHLRTRRNLSDPQKFCGFDAAALSASALGRT